MAYEKTFVLLKPDAVQRGLIDPITAIFRENDLDILAQTTKRADSVFIMQHLDYDPAYVQTIGRKVSRLYDAKGLDREASLLGHYDAQQIGDTLMHWMTDYLTSGETVAYVLGGENAVLRTKELCGATFPADADKTSIRGMYGDDSFETCMQECRAPYNIIHAADSEKEAAHQIHMWFPEYRL